MTISSLAKIFGAIMFNTSTPETTKPAGADKKTSAAEAAVAAAELFKADCVIVEDMCNWHNFVFEINEPAAIPPRRESSHHSPTGSVSSSASSDRLRSPTKPHASPKVDHKGMHLDPIRSTKLGDFKGPLAMP